MSDASPKNGCAATFLIVLGLSMLAPGGLCIVLSPALGAPLILLGGLCIFAAIKLRRGK